MATVRAQSLTADALARRMGCAGLMAGAAGGLGAYVRPMLAGPIHYEVVISHFVILPAIFFLIVWSMRLMPWRKVSIYLLITVYLTCIAFTVGWWLVDRQQRDDMVLVMIVYAIIAATASWLVLVTIQYFRRPVHGGPYCLSCSYCLVGTQADRCPECGRDFTLEELGVTRDELRPAGISSTRT